MPSPVTVDRCQLELLSLADDGFDISTQLGDRTRDMILARKDHKDAMAGAVVLTDGSSEDRRRAEATRNPAVRELGDRVAAAEAEVARLRIVLDDTYRRQDVWRTLASTARRLLPEQRAGG